MCLHSFEFGSVFTLNREVDEIHSSWKQKRKRKRKRKYKPANNRSPTLLGSICIRNSVSLHEASTNVACTLRFAFSTVSLSLAWTLRMYRGYFRYIGPNGIKLIKTGACIVEMRCLFQMIVPPIAKWRRKQHFRHLAPAIRNVCKWPDVRWAISVLMACATWVLAAKKPAWYRNWLERDAKARNELRSCQLEPNYMQFVVSFAQFLMDSATLLSVDSFAAFVSGHFGVHLKSDS